eukprot:TRINITY_DN8024_c0_g1_i1.p1 TRINITY_DN8024_c0_g1~~TRINITY_DN8024_c0_g1_i1.p1  ORF type:complete len:384 (+),score=111.16 TRINITY_DN8024_c0_g1_i1:60-1211(+)
MPAGKPPGTFEAKDPKERIPEATAIRLVKEMGGPAGIILRQYKKGVIEIRDTQKGLPAHNQDIQSHRGWLIVGINNRPVYTVVEIGDLLKECSCADINVVMPMPGDIPPAYRGNKNTSAIKPYSAHRSGEDEAQQDTAQPPSSAQPREATPSSYSPPSYASKFRPGDRVDVYYGAEDGLNGGGVWYPSEVTAILHDGTYAVTFDTGEAAEGVAAHSMRMQGMPSPTSSAIASPRHELRKGDRVEVFYGPDEDGWYQAVISNRNRDGSYTVRFDTGEISEGVSRDYLRPVEEDYYGSGAYSSFSQRNESPVPPHLGVNSQAEVLWEGTQWTPCVIKAYHPHTNMYDVDWMDGTETNGVMAVHVRPASGPVSTTSRVGSSSPAWR